MIYIVMKGFEKMVDFKIIDNSDIGYALFEAIRNDKDCIEDFVYSYANDAYFKIVDLDKSIVGLSRKERSKIFNSESTQRLRLLSDVLIGKVEGYFEHFSNKTGQWYIIHMSVPFKDHISCFYVPVYQKQTYLLSNSQLQNVNYRSESLIRTMAYQSKDLEDFLNFALLEIIELTNSKAGRLYTLEENNTFRSIASSQIKEGEGSITSLEPSIEKIEAIIVQNTVILENSTLEQVSTINEINPSKIYEIYLPIKDKGEIVTVMWLCGKTTEYNDKDVQQIIYIMEGIWNIAKRRQAEENLNREKQFLNMTIESINEGIVSLDKYSKIISINKKAELLLEVRSEAVKEEHISKLFVNMPSEIALIFDEILSDHYEKLKDWTKTIRFEKNGDICIYKFSISIILNEFNESEGFVLLIQDITEETLDKERILYISYHDMLTGLYNRLYFEQEILRLDIEKNYPISILLCDLNGLKLTNDAFGHQEGDKLLVMTAELFKANRRPQDIAARWGGDEFVLLLPNTTQEEAEKIARNIKTACKNKSTAIIELSISIGIATKRTSDLLFSEILTLAENNMYTQKLIEKKSQRSKIIEAIKNSLYERNHETEEHAERLIELSMAVAEKFQLSQKDKDDLRLLALLHDIGKIGIADHILLKPGALTKEEWIEMRKHPYIGYRIASVTPDLNQIAKYILYHHEKYDGTGYPTGLRGKEIPLLSRIISVVDAFDAMKSDRPYRKALSNQDVIDELRRFSGSQFDPEIIKVFLSIVEEAMH